MERCGYSTVHSPVGRCPALKPQPTRALTVVLRKVCTPYHVPTAVKPACSGLAGLPVKVAFQHTSLDVLERHGYGNSGAKVNDNHAPINSIRSDDGTQTCDVAAHHVRTERIEWNTDCRHMLFPVLPLTFIIYLCDRKYAARYKTWDCSLS